MIVLTGGNFDLLIGGGFQRVVGSPVVVTRPNNVTAYAAGQVFGAAADARISFPVPALPEDAVSPGYDSIVMAILNRRDSSAAQLGFRVHYFNGLPATVIGDQGAFSISDADIDLRHFQQTLAIPTGIGDLASLNQTVGANGRRFTSAGTGGAASPTAGSGLIRGVYLAPGSVLGCYLVLSGAYTPLALEQIVLTPRFLYLSRR